MARTLLVVPCAAGVGVARTSIAVLRALDRRGVRTGYVKPVAQPRPDGGPDRSTALVSAITALHPPDPLPSEAVEHQLGEGGIDAVLEEIVAVCRPVQDGADVVVVEGLSPLPMKVYSSELNGGWAPPWMPTFCWSAGGRPRPSAKTVASVQRRMGSGAMSSG